MQTMDGPILKDVTKIKNVTEHIIGQYGENPHTELLRNVSMNSISDSGENVNGNSIQRSLAANESERQMLEGYKDAAARLDANEQRIAAINAELRDARWTEPNSDRKKALLSERKQLEAEITAADKRLYEMERMAPMKRIAQKQRAKAESDLARAKEHLRRYREGVAKRESIARITSENALRYTIVAMMTSVMYSL